MQPLALGLASSSVGTSWSPVPGCVVRMEGAVNNRSGQGCRWAAAGTFAGSLTGRVSPASHPPLEEPVSFFSAPSIALLLKLWAENH